MKEVPDRRRRLLWHGTMLVLMGLLVGAVAPLMTNPRAGVSAHLTGLLGGMLLIVFGAIWGELGFTSARAAWARSLLLYSTYSVWIGATLAAVLGTRIATPIAGAGYAGTRMQELLVLTLLGSGAIAALLAVGLVLHGLRDRRD